MMIDVYPHILPPKYKEALYKKLPPNSFDRKQADAFPSLTDLDIRFRIMDKYEDLVQVLTLGSPPIHDFVGPEDALELVRIANDEMAELVVKYPDRFVSAIASLPLNYMDAALRETDRAIGDLRFRGIQISTDVNGKPIDSPEFMPLYEKLSYYDLPILLHPRRANTVSDYPEESESKYGTFITFGWPYETTVAMTRLVFSGVFEKYPNLKVITHHCGAMVPYFAERIALVTDNREMRMGFRYEENLTKHPLDYYRMFYGDTALCGSTPALMCGYAFFGADHILFGTDMPYDNQLGDRFIRETILSVKQMDIPEPQRKQIFQDNARRLLRLPL
jgi:predicted TIM-barrel fold metal-dependent hydrolase